MFEQCYCKVLNVLAGIWQVTEVGAVLWPVTECSCSAMARCSMFVQYYGKVQNIRSVLGRVAEARSGLVKTVDM